MKISSLAEVLVQQELWLSFFVIGYTAIILFWSGASFLGLSGIKDKISPYVSIFGIDQNWSLFSPTVRTINLHNLAIISFADGSLKLYEWPRMEKLDIFEKIKKEKYRKMFNDCLPWSEYRVLLPAPASLLARANFNPNNPPERLLLSYFWTNIPTAKGWINKAPLPEHNQLKNYFIYQVQPEDLTLRK